MQFCKSGPDIKMTESLKLIGAFGPKNNLNVVINLKLKV